ncbi:hypothetical protein [Oryza sativa Japonica Group]|uniref:Uncharacterized protein n=1 Tax=Oryza sativa subsp. japonica TaxID=39947 RepID=Q5QM52_ORYSJ|nr:hypothetical protein [Oryza sativa Japonica Group]
MDEVPMQRESASFQSKEGRDAPNAKVVGEDGEQVEVNGVLVPNEHGFGGQEGVVESEHMEDVVGELMVDYLA